MVPAEHADPVYPPVQGELPVPRRARVKLNSPERPAADDEDVRVYALPPDTGLGTFDLGSVPASVTPPRSWRKAAWFATASSGGVVLALLFAGSALVGKVPADQPSGGWVPGLGGGQPAVGGEQTDTVTGNPATGDAPTVEKITGSLPSDVLASASASIRQPASVAASAGLPRATASPSGTPVPMPSPVPPKPAWAPAPYDADPFRVALPEGSPDEFAEDSQKFFAAVTENPAAAHAMTAGDLRKKGAGELARRYARVAYFVVKYVKVHQYEGRTVCTVRTVYKDGTQAIEQRVLTFARGKIDSDG